MKPFARTLFNSLNNNIAHLFSLTLIKSITFIKLWSLNFKIIVFRLKTSCYTSQSNYSIPITLYK